ncbi:prolactin regulatory element-binding protein [Zeugodacus cucurbitae]|uniref:prolactin regulatory element-binding protein n=1 Tax=Zeugodacus cucurbitae TaxID=28588 RepID=UPI000596ABA6|nr:prolactin regulatory element-binding protein [Zeugodacus cucurbitae]
MAPTRRPSDGLLARVNFPLYAVEMLTSRHVLVAGGGGSAKTGVANGFEIYEIYHNGTHFCAEEVVRHETGANVVMNFAVRNDGRRSYLCAGQESHCQLYFVNPRIVYEGQEDVTADADERRPRSNSTAEHGNENGVRRRVANANAQASGVQDLPNGHATGATKKTGDQNANLKRIRFDIKAGDSVQTDFLTSEPLQRVVRISPNGRLMATGGTDGHLRVWTFPQMVQRGDLASHTKEIDDIDFSPDSKYIVTISKDGQGLVWDLTSMKQHNQLKWTTPEGSKYLYKRCRYGTIEAQRDKYRLFTITNPLGKVGKQRGFLQQWDCISGQLRSAVQVDESLASLAVRDDGRFVAVGTMFSGSVSIYIAFSLQRVLHIPNAHSMFVTGLQFLPITNEEGPPISSDTEAAVLSISVDNKVCIHSLQQRRTIPAWVAILLIIVVLFGAFALCSYIGI